MTDEQLRAELDADQYAAVTAPLKNCLCVANAGSGKTRTLVYRIAYWLSQGEPEDSFLMLTFTNKAADEMMGRIQKLLNKARVGIMGGTFHSVALRFLQKYVRFTDWDPGFTVYDTGDSVGLIRLCREKYCAEHDIDRKAFCDAETIQRLYSYCRNKLIPFDTYAIDVEMDAVTASGVKEILLDYEDRKRKYNSMDFDDLLEQFDKILSEPEAAARIRAKYRNIFVDEYQDINDVQNSIIHKLVGRTNRLTAVGDEAQCIYGFRGSEVEYILRFQKEYPDVSVFSIRTNYRSSMPVVTSALQVINESPVYADKKKVMLPHVNSGTKIQLVDVETDWDQAEMIADKISALVRGGSSYGSIAILSRTNTLPKLIETVLLDRHIPVTMNCGIPFFDRAHIRVMMGYLRFVANPINEVAFWAIFDSAEGIGPKTVKKMFAAFDESKFDLAKLERLKVPSKANRDFNQIVSAIWDGLELYRNHSMHDLSVLMDIFYASYFKIRMMSLYRDNWNERQKDIEILRQLLSKYSDLEAFINNMSLVGKEDSVANGKVLITTAHKAKGLEWDTVFIPYCNDGVYPFTSCKTENEVEEERRLLYVAMTRARKNLCLCSVSDSKIPYIGSDRSEFLNVLMGDNAKDLVSFVYGRKQPAYSGYRRFGVL